MRIFLSVGLVFLLAGVSPSFADELDGEQGVVNATNTELNGTVVIRVNSATNEVARLEVSDELTTNKELIAVTKEKFDKVPEARVTEQELGELDRDAGQSSWHYYWPRYRTWGHAWNYGYYFYRGSYYRPYRRYRRGTYYFYYYNRWYRWY